MQKKGSNLAMASGSKSNFCFRLSLDLWLPQYLHRIAEKVRYYLSMAALLRGRKGKERTTGNSMKKKTEREGERERESERERELEEKEKGENAKKCPCL